MRVIPVLLCVLCAPFLFAACSPEVGSVAWCKALEEKSKMDWSAREFKDYANHCLNRKD